MGVAAMAIILATKAEQRTKGGMEKVKELNKHSLVVLLPVRSAHDGHTKMSECE